jgi:hypothetical protein
VIEHRFHDGQFAINRAVPFPLLGLVINALFALFDVAVKFRSADAACKPTAEESSCNAVNRGLEKRYRAQKTVSERNVCKTRRECAGAVALSGGIASQAGR